MAAATRAAKNREAKTTKTKVLFRFCLFQSSLPKDFLGIYWLRFNSDCKAENTRCQPKRNFNTLISSPLWRNLQVNPSANG
jgi:hypothetical protein